MRSFRRLSSSEALEPLPHIFDHTTLVAMVLSSSPLVLLGKVEPHGIQAVDLGQRRVGGDVVRVGGDDCDGGGDGGRLSGGFLPAGEVVREGGHAGGLGGAAAGGEAVQRGEEEGVQVAHGHGGGGWAGVEGLHERLGAVGDGRLRGGSVCGLHASSGLEFLILARFLHVAFSSFPSFFPIGSKSILCGEMSALTSLSLRRLRRSSAYLGIRTAPAL